VNARSCRPHIYSKGNLNRSATISDRCYNSTRAETKTLPLLTYRVGSSYTSMPAATTTMSDGAISTMQNTSGLWQRPLGLLKSQIDTCVANVRQPVLPIGAMHSLLMMIHVFRMIEYERPFNTQSTSPQLNFHFIPHICRSRARCKLTFRWSAPEASTSCQHVQGSW